MEEPTTFIRIPLKIQVDNLLTEGWADRRDLAQNERLLRAAKIFGVFFGVALVTVFVPILHFILPPLFLIIGAVLAFGEYGGRGEVLTGEFTCPNCQKHMTLPNETEEWPKTQRCSGCSFTLKIEPSN